MRRFQDDIGGARVDAQGGAVLERRNHFPVAIPAWKAAPALVDGSTVARKPPALFSHAAQRLAEVLHEAGVLGSRRSRSTGRSCREALR